MTELVTSDQVAAFRAQGAVLLRGVLDESTVDLIRQGIEEVFAQPSAFSTRTRDKQGKGLVGIDQHASMRSASIAQFVEQSPAAAIAGQLMGSTASRFLMDQIFYKEAGYILPTDWHQDTPYFRISGHDLARLWTPVDSSPARTTVRVVKGSHLWNVTYRPVGADDTVTVEAGDGFSYGTDDCYDNELPPIPDINHYREAFDIMSWDVEPGDILAFNGNVIHGADGNFDHPTKRRALATVWAGDDVRQVARPGVTIPDRASLQGIEIAPGELLSDHPEAYPALWTA